MNAIQRLGQRMAARNNLPLFAWIAALILPAALQLIAGMQEDVRSYLTGYYGPFTLYFFFVMTYGFATIFVCFYQLSSYRKQGTLDMLRIAQLTPGEVLRDVFVQLQRVLLPPIMAFALVFFVYLMLSSDRATILGFGRTTIASGMFGVALTEMLLCAIVCNGLLRAEAMLSALAALLVLPLNTAPIVLLFYAEALRVRWQSTHMQGLETLPMHRSGDTVLAQTYSAPMPPVLALFTAAPWLFYSLGMLMALVLTLLLAWLRLRQLWPPQLRPTKN